jgi:hypothetical protein
MFARAHLSGKKLVVVVCAYHPNDDGKLNIEGLQSKLAGAKSKTLYQK